MRVLRRCVLSSIESTALMSPNFRPRSSRSKENAGFSPPGPESDAELRHRLEHPGRVDLAGDGRHRLARDLLVLGDAHVADVAGELLERVGAHRAAHAVHLLRHRHRRPLAVGRRSSRRGCRGRPAESPCRPPRGCRSRASRTTAPSFEAAPFIATSTCFPSIGEADARFERRRMELRLRLLRLLQELLGAVALLGAAAREEERRADHDGEEPDHGAGIGTGR